MPKRRRVKKKPQGASETRPIVEKMSATSFRAMRDGPKKKAPRRSKYGVSPPEERRVDGRTFDSKKEAKRYQALKELQASGAVRWLALQPVFLLPGGVTYRADFVIAWEDGTTTVEDVKGVRTDLYKTKKAIVEDLFDVEIVET